MKTKCDCAACLGTFRGIVRHLRMLKEASPLRCSNCGKFISFEDIRTGKASYKMLTPDSHLSTESYEGLCCRCKQAA